jgi:PHD/YefM family antitoxin component YafN of YafNO toxin-antitoxin module
MERILTEMTTTISKFKENPAQAVRQAKGEPFAVLTNNKASFYVLSPEYYDKLLELIWELENAPEWIRRASEPHKAIRVNLEDL